MPVRLATRAALAVALWPSLASAQPVVTSAGPERVSVTIYRAPDRSTGEATDLRWLGGYALITEERAVDLPAGRATIKFEGVAGGMLPESAIVRGLPAEVREKNLDAALLTPRSLYAHTLGRPVTLRRRHLKTGQVTEEPAIVRSSPEGGVILETRAGFEAADCGPLEDSLVYPRAPAGLSARPTLSVETDGPAPTRATLSLSYLAWGFDWQTNYVLRMEPGARRAELSSWVTLASSDSTSFADATLAVVAGDVNREDRAGRRTAGEDGERVFQCYLSAIPLPAIPAAMAVSAPLAEIVVTARRIQDKAKAVTASLEDLGDLKLYRMPFNSTVAAHSQKQVAMMAPRKVRLAPVYVSEIYAGEASTVRLELHGRNRKQDGLGIPLPSGHVAVFEGVDGAQVLIGEGHLADKAVDEKFEIAIAEATQVAVKVKAVRQAAGWREFEVQVANANPWPVVFVAPILVDDDERVEGASAALGRKNGRPLWSTRAPANGVARLRVRIVAVRP